MLKLSISESYERLFAVFSQFYPLSQELKAAIIGHSKLINVAKKQFLLKQGEKSDKIYFIVEGAVRIYYLNKDGQEKNTWFLFENEMVVSVHSFFSSQASFEYIKTLEDCSLIVLSRKKLEQLYEKFVSFNIIGRKLTEYYYIRNEAQANSLRMHSAKERYHQLVEVQPQILRRVPLGHIASYLGISAETLSRIRSRI